MKCFCEAFFFPSLSSDNFSYCPRFLILTKNLNTTRTPSEMKQNLLHFFLVKIFVIFAIKHQSRQVKSFPKKAILDIRGNAF